MVLSCDIGTSSLKMGVIDRTGALRFYARWPTGTANARAWLAAFKRSVNAVDRDLKRSIRAVAVSGHGPTLVPVDARGRPTAAALMWHRPAPRQDLPIISSSYYLPRVFRFSRENPRAYAGAASLLPTAEYIVAALSGVRAAAIPHDGFAPLYWTAGDIAGFGLDPHKFPPLITTGGETGKLSRAWAAATGLPEGLPVFACGADFLMAFLGSGSFAPGLTCDRGGTTEAVNHCSRAPLSTPQLRLVPGLRHGTYTVSGFLPETGRWHARLKEELVGKRGSYDDFAALADRSVPGVSRLRFRPEHAAGRPVRRLAGSMLFSGVRDDTGPGDYVRALFEHTGFSIRRIIAVLEKFDAAVDALRSTGGFARCDRLTQAKATMTGLPVTVNEIEDAELLGDAIVAFTALADFSTWEEAAQRLVRVRRGFEPEPVEAALYADLFDEWCRNDDETRS